MPEALNLPAAMVERAARVLYNAQSPAGTDWWAVAEHETRQLWRVKAGGALLTTLAGCEVREEWGVRSQWLEEPDDYWRGRRDQAQRSLELRRASSTVQTTLVRRLTITTPGEEVPDAD